MVNLAGDIGVAGVEVHNAYNPTANQLTYEHGIFGNSTPTTTATSIKRMFLAIGYWK
jgi:hypothetical protein